LADKVTTPTLVDRWITELKNHRLTALLIFLALTIGGIATALKSITEIRGMFIDERVSVTFLDPVPTEPRTATILIRNEGSETAVAQNLVFNVNLKTSVGLKNGFGVLFPVGGARAIATGKSETIKFEPAAAGMFLPSEPSNPEFVEFFASLAKGTGIDPDIFRLRQLTKATCQMSVDLKYSSSSKTVVFPVVNCQQLWPLFRTEFATR
jgi:hypothetical protein